MISILNRIFKPEDLNTSPTILYTMTKQNTNLNDIAQRQYKRMQRVRTIYPHLFKVVDSVRRLYQRYEATTETPKIKRQTRTDQFKFLYQ